MAFVTKTWKDRLVEYAGRRKIKNVATGEETLVDVSRSEGTVSQAGDAFSAANMNNLEQRIKNEFDTVNSSLADGQITFSVVNGDPYVKVGADAARPFKSSGGGIPPIKSIQYTLYGNTVFRIQIIFDVTNYTSMKLNGSTINLSNITEYTYTVINNKGASASATIENPITDVT